MNFIVASIIVNSIEEATIYASHDPPSDLTPYEASCSIILLILSNPKYPT